MKCYKGGTQHKFEPRYEERPNAHIKSLWSPWASPQEFRELVYYSVYIRDVCVWCGKTIEREEA